MIPFCRDSTIIRGGVSFQSAARRLERGLDLAFVSILIPFFPLPFPVCLSLSFVLLSMSSLLPCLAFRTFSVLLPSLAHHSAWRPSLTGLFMGLSSPRLSLNILSFPRPSLCGGPDGGVCGPCCGGGRGPPVPLRGLRGSGPGPPAGPDLAP